LRIEIYEANPRTHVFVFYILHCLTLWRFTFFRGIAQLNVHNPFLSDTAELSDILITIVTSETTTITCVASKICHGFCYQ